MATDYKEWISERAEELAQERYNKGFYDLTNDIQMELWQYAEADWINREAARIDAAYDAAMESQMMESCDVDSLGHRD